MGSTGDKKSKSEKTAKAALAIAVGAMPGLFTSKPAEAALGGAIALAAVGVDTLIEAVTAQRRKRTEDLLGSLVFDAASPEEAAGRVRAAIENPTVAPSIIEAAKAMDALVDERVIPAIGALMRAYALGEKPVDRFYRGALRLFSESTAEDLARVASFAEIATRFPGEDHEVLFMPHFQRDPSMPMFQVNEPEAVGHAMFFRVPGGVDTPSAMAHQRLARVISYDERGRPTFTLLRSDARALFEYIAAAGIERIEPERLGQ